MHTHTHRHTHTHIYILGDQTCWNKNDKSK